ncbi:ComF family protein [Candidatus Dependentiae bacterium]|nr:MAG: ComF family protein [Candidatus Dependentiae bacterium]
MLKIYILQLTYAFFNQLYQLVFPAYCFCCKQFCTINTYGLCNACSLQIAPVATIDIVITKNISVTVFAASFYQDPVKMLILAKQYQQMHACKAIGELIWAKTDTRFQEFDLIVPIPLHWTRYAKRGYNQAEEIAHVLGNKMHIPVVNLLKRTKATAFQATLSKDARSFNVADVFALAKEEYKNIYKNKRILLVDDLLTTGSTISSASKILLELKPTILKAAVGARVQ